MNQLEQIRKTYGVSAKRGARIEWTDSRGQKWKGTILGATVSGHLRVRFDAFRKGTEASIIHPGDVITYLPPATAPQFRGLACKEPTDG